MNKIKYKRNLVVFFSNFFAKYFLYNSITDETSNINTYY